jgi:hypothetical protein
MQGLIDILQAIGDATKAGADIINCSWTIDSHDTPLKLAIEEATRQGPSSKNPILIFCATSDEPHQSWVWPADFSPTCVIRVAAASSRGRRQAESPQDVDLLILGENMPADGLNYGRLTKALFGSLTMFRPLTRPLTSQCRVH